MNRRSGRLLACLLVLGLVSACQTPAVAPERFALEAAQSPSLVVRVRQPRRVQAVVGDVDHLLVTVKAADGAEPTRRIAASEFSGSDASVTFSSLASGEATVEVRALSAASLVLGRASAQATVTPGMLTEVAVPLQLDPAYAEQGTATSAAIALDVQVRNGDSTVAQPSLAHWGTVVAFYIEHGHRIEQLAVNPQGGISLGWEDGSWNYSMHPPQGGGPASAGLAIDGMGRLWAGGRHDTSLRIGSTKTFTLPAPPTLGGIAVDGTENGWVANGSRVTKIEAAGSEVGSFDLGGTAGALTVDRASGDVWVGAGRDLVRLSPSGQEEARASGLLTPGDVWRDVAVDSTGNAWAIQHYAHRVVKVAPDGSLLGQFKVTWRPYGVVCDAAGHAYVVGLDGVYKLASDGEVLGRHPFEGWGPGIIETDVHGDILIDEAGDVWASHNDDMMGALLQIRP